VQQLKEMVILPLLYPALMAHMHITPPRHAQLPHVALYKNCTQQTR